MSTPKMPRTWWSPSEGLVQDVPTALYVHVASGEPMVSVPDDATELRPIREGQGATKLRGVCSSCGDVLPLVLALHHDRRDTSDEDRECAGADDYPSRIVTPAQAGSQAEGAGETADGKQ